MYYGTITLGKFGAERVLNTFWTWLFTSCFLKECWQTFTPKWNTFESGDLLTRLENGARFKHEQLWKNTVTCGFCTDSGHITLIFAQCDHTIRPPIPFMNWWFFVYNLNLLGTVAELLWQMCFLCISSTIAKLKQNKNEDESCPNHSSFQNYFQ